MGFDVGYNAKATVLVKEILEIVGGLEIGYQRLVYPLLNCFVFGGELIFNIDNPDGSTYMLHHKTIEISKVVDGKLIESNVEITHKLLEELPTLIERQLQIILSRLKE